MGIRCGSQIILCDLPIRFDTYVGCSHACKYCFVKRQHDISLIEKDNCLQGLKSFLMGKRSGETAWCDWKIPLHWGGMSDPFQPVEAKHRVSLEALKLFAATHYPVVFSTKGRIVAEPEYLALIKDCNAVAQVSMVCDKYDVLEQGAPPYEERLRMVEKLAKVTRRVIVRVQPYMLEIREELLKNLPRLKAAGVYGITIEGMKFLKAKPGLVRVGGDNCYPKEKLARDFRIIRDACHREGLAFFCAENRLRGMGDGMCCCGVEGLEDFRTNTFNLVHILNGDKVEPTERMREIDTALTFKTLHMTTVFTRHLREISFYSGMMEQLKTELSTGKYGFR